MKLRFTSRATRDLEEIAERLRDRNPSAALAVRDAILRSLQNLTLFRRSVVPKVSKASANSWRANAVISSITFIDAEAEEVVILTIQHPARSREYRDV